MTRHGLLAAAVALFLVVAQVATVAAAPGQGNAGERAGSAAPIDKGLQRDLKAGTATKIVVEFDAKASLNAAKKVKDREKRGDAVVKALKTTAAVSQRTARATVAKTKGAKATSYWLVNVLVVEGDAKTLDKVAKQLAKQRGVTSIRAPKIYPLVKPVETSVAILALAGDPEWGVEKIRANEAWADGVLGQGIVVANVDTGVEFDHEALIEQYRGNLGGGNFDHNYNWWDPTGICGDVPCDNAGHGTHTMGTMVGGDGPGPFAPDTGVAPGAKWIAAKGCEDFGCSDIALLSAGQFILEPTDLAGENPDGSKRPDIVNNSWGGGPGSTFYLEIVQAWRTAGIIPVFSSGNPGPFCGEGGSPGDYLESFSAGATDENDVIADFSGRGPSAFGKINPDVAAPGVDVISSVPGGGYDAFSGTSMAAPHVAGALALMLSAEPALRGDYDAATAALRATAVDRIDDSCGGDEDGDPNNVYGDGRIDAKAAVDLVATGGTLSGTVTDLATSDPIAGVKVTADDGTRQFSAITDGNGDYDLFLAAGTYDVTTEAFGYAPDGAAGVVIVTDETTDLDLILTALPRFDITGIVRAAEDGSPIEGASVLALGTPVPPATTDAAGAYTLTLPIGSYAIRGSAGGCTEVQIIEGVELTDSDITLDFTLGRKLDDFGHGCHPIALDWVDATTDTALFGDDWVGRLRLPFSFAFYGETYDQVFLSDNGYINFLSPDLYNPFPISIPNEGPPNAAIYAMWNDLYLDEGSSIAYATVGAAGDRAFVLEYDNARIRGATSPIDFEIKIHESGETVDLLFGNNPANPGDGRGATIGIEDAAGADALEFQFGDALLGPNSAYRFEIVPVATIHGTVTDANDGEPIDGASVAASPGLQATTTAADGTYTLRVYPGDYQITISKSGYVSETTPLSLAAGDDVTLDAALDAGIPAVEPLTLEASLAFGADPVTQNVTLSNTGSAPFDWEAKERSRGSTPVVIPAGTAGKGAAAGSGGTSRLPLKPISPRRVTPHIDAQPALVLMDNLPWDSDGLLQVLDANSVPFDLADSSQMATIDFSAYSFVIVSNDQSQEFYDAYEASSGRFADYVSGGGFLWMETASGGFNGGDLSGATLPGGVTVSDFVFDEFNDVAEPGHELMVGVPDPFFGTYASHNVYENVPSDATILATSASTGDPTLIEYDFGGGHVVAFAQPMEWAFSHDEDSVRILENAVPYAANFYRDLSWLSEDPSTGTLGIGGSTDVAITIGDPSLAPGEYRGSVVFVTTAPKPRQVTVDVTLTVELPESWGGLAGTVTDAHSEEPLGGAVVTVHSQWAGAPFDITASTADDGTYSLIGPEGTWPITFSKDGYVSVDSDATIVRGVTTTGIDAALHRSQPHATFEGGPFEFTLTPGRTGTGTVTAANPGGHTDLEIEVGEVNLGGPSSTAAVPGSTSKVKLPAGAKVGARTTRGLGAVSVGRAVPSAIASTGDVLASWPAEGMELPWGVGYTGNVWLGDAFDNGDICAFGGVCSATEFEVDGTPTGVTFEEPWVGIFGGDMAFDAGRNLLWQVNVGGDNGIYGLDPADGSVEQVITGSPWGNIPQRGLAYDPNADVFYIGGWDDGPIYRVAGPSHPTPGETLGDCLPPDLGTSGLAWNSSFGMLWQATNSDTDTIWLLDPTTCEASAALPHPDGGPFNGAGLETDVVGNLWTVGQNSGNAYLIESGLPNFSDVPWLTVDPTDATIAPDGSLDFEITVDSTGLEPGVYRALVVLLSNDPDNSMYQVPVTLTVPTYQQGINAGGGASTNSNGDVFAADRAYGPGPYGYLGSSSTRSTSAAIEGTEDDGLYQDSRTGMTNYRFAVPDGTYRVDLLFAEIENVKAGARKFDVSIEGDVVLPGLDIVAAAGGTNTALDRSFVVNVADGLLDIQFASQRGDKPTINAILVTGLPEGAPGT